MRYSTLAYLLIATLLATTPVAEAQFWNPFKSKEAKPTTERSPEPVSPQGGVEQASFESPAAADYRLSQTSGPWLIMATTFSGEGAEDQARDLSYELTKQYGMKTYVHEMTFDFTKGDEQLGRGIDKYGEPIKMRYRSGEKRQEWAVLVGDFTTVDDTLAERELARIKSIRPGALDINSDGSTSQNYAQIRQAQKAVLAKLGKKLAADGPMRTAFLTRNPTLPAEYFVPKGVEKFVEKMNKSLEYSLLKAKGRYTVKVATFRGRGVLQGATSAKSSAAKRRKNEIDPLVKAAEDAHLLCEAMRRQGWEAYEFHDRTESYVTVGSYDALTKSGKIVAIDQVTDLGQLKSEILKTVQTFGAQYKTAQVPIDEHKGGAASQSRVDEAKQTFNQLYSSEVGQVAGGMNPKYAQVFVEKVKGKSTYRPITFDIHPELIEAPKKTVSGGFAWRR